MDSGCGDVMWGSMMWGTNHDFFADFIILLLKIVGVGPCGTFVLILVKITDHINWLTKRI